jgi:hypothetical protein
MDFQLVSEQVLSGAPAIINLFRSAFGGTRYGTLTAILEK